MRTIFFMMRSLFTMLLLSACSSAVDINPSLDKVEETFQLLLEEAIDDSYDQVKGVSMAVIAPDLGIDWAGANGFDSKDKENELSADQPFRIASITKTFVAAAILRLQEEGLINIEEPISKYISEKHIDILLKGGYQPDSITLRHCLHHTSGLYDYAMGGTYGELVKKNPKKRWTRTEQLQLSMDTGEAIGYPGEKYRYSDTGYILLGEIIESKVDSTLGNGLHDLLQFEKLGLKSTWLESIDPTPPDLPSFVRRYLGSIDATDFDNSIDLYGGGGLVSTCSELAIFMQALFTDQIYKQPETLDLMLSKASYYPSYEPEKDPRYKDYRLGLWELNIYGQKGYRHGGLWGTMLIHVPAYNCSIAVNYTRGKNYRLAKKVIGVIKNLSENKQ